MQNATNLKKSEICLNQALKISVGLNDVRSQALQFKHFSKLAMLRNEFSTAETFIQKSLQIDLEGNNKFGEAESKRLFGHLKQLKGDLTYLEHYNDALNIYNELNLTNHILEMQELLKAT